MIYLLGLGQVRARRQTIYLVTTMVVMVLSGSYGWIGDTVIAFTLSVTGHRTSAAG